MTNESFIDLPKDLILPSYHGPSGIKDYEDRAVLLLSVGKNGFLTVTKEDGTTSKIWEQKDIPLLFPNKFNFIYSPNNEIDSFTKPLNLEQRMFLFYCSKTSIPNYTINWIPDLPRITIQENGNAKTTRYLINLAKFVSKRKRNHIEQSFTSIKEVLRQFMEYHSYIPINPLSLASTTKDFILSDDKCRREFELVPKLFSIDMLTKFRRCYKGPGRHETSKLGTFTSAAEDMVRAHLNILATIPGLWHNVVRIYEGDKFIPEAHPGSWYKLWVNIKRGYKFPPIPYIYNYHLSYPFGEYTVEVSKPFVEILLEEGVEFKILESLQVIIKDHNYCPFRDIANLINYAEDTCKGKLPLIDHKALHYTIVGHMIHVRKEVDIYTGVIKHIASQDFHPLFASAVQGLLAKEIWRRAVQFNSVSIRIDAHNPLDLPSPNPRFSLTLPGTWCFLTPTLKDKPGEPKIYEELIKQYRDKPYVCVHLQRRISFREGWRRNTTGKEAYSTVTISPHGGSRHLPYIKRVGCLLDGDLETEPVHIDNVPNLYTPSEVERWLKINETLVDLYLHSLLQTQT